MKKKIIIGVLALCAIGAIFGGSSDDKDIDATHSPEITAQVGATDNVETQAPEQLNAPEINPETEPTPELSTTMGERNALGKAHDYLNYSAFSYTGLIGQLEYEGYTTEEATYAVDNCGADWSEQAALKAQDYLDYSEFSRDGLISQLEYEGFTAEQSIYGVEQVGY